MTACREEKSGSMSTFPCWLGFVHDFLACRSSRLFLTPERYGILLPRHERSVSGRGFQQMNHLRFATRFAGRVDLANSMFRFPVTGTATSACSNCVSIDDSEDPRIGHITVLSWRATAELLLQLIASRRTESADRVCGDLTR